MLLGLITVTVARAGTPTILVPDVAPVDISVSGNRLYWNDTGVAQLQAVDADTGAILQNRSEPLAMNKGVLASGQNLYFMGSDFFVRKTWRLEGPSVRLAASYPSGMNIGGVGNLALQPGFGVADGPYLCWGDAQGLHRVNLAAGFTAITGPLDPVQSDIVLLAGLQDPDYWLAADADYVYWSQLEGGWWGIFRAPAAGGPPQRLCNLFSRPTHLAVDGTHIYWAEAGAKIARAPKAAPFTDPDLVFQSADFNFVASGLVVDNANVYWTQRRPSGGVDISLRRSPKAVSAPLTLALGTGATLLRQNTANLYWADSAGIRRLEKDAPGVSGDFTVRDVEITQAIQNLDNDIGFFADKPTVVRVYPLAHLNGATRANVEVALRGFRGSTPLPGSPLRRTVDLRDGALPRREDARSTVNFVLPPTWLSNSVRLETEINPVPALVPEPAAMRGDNAHTNNLSFQRKEGVCLLTRSLLHTNGSQYRIANPSFPGILQRFRSLVPAADVRVRELAEAFGPRDVVGDGLTLSDLNASMLFSDAGAAGRGARRFHLGLVSDDANTSLGGGRIQTGLGFYLGSCWVKMHNLNPGPFDAPGGGVTMIHEVAHTMGWAHVAICGAGGIVDLAYPYSHPLGVLDDGTRSWGRPFDRQLFFGFDPISGAAIPPTSAFDFMGYCTPQWICDAHWRDLANSFANVNTAALAIAPDRAPKGTFGPIIDRLFVSGVFALDGKAVTFGPTYRMPWGFLSQEKIAELNAAQAPFTQPGSSHALELLASDGTVLFSQPFEPLPGPTDADQAQPANFYLTIPFDPTTARLRVVHNGTELGGLAASPNPPSIALTKPKAGALFTEPFEVAWAAADVDGDQLKHLIQYSNDGGQSWEVLALDYVGTSYMQAVEHLPGGNSCLVRVLAKDDLNGAFAVSGPFAVATHAPHAAIVSPPPAKVFQTGEPIVLEGFGYDTEDGSLGSSAFSWRVGDAGPVLSGNPALLTELAPGTYHLNLTVTDAEGKQGQATSAFVVVEPRQSKCAEYFADFKLFPPQTRLFGDAVIAPSGGTDNSEVLTLTGTNFGKMGSIVIDDLLGLPVTSFAASFKAYLGGGTTPGADGFSFCVANDLPDAAFGELGAGSGLIVAFNSFDNGGEDAPAIDVIVRGVRIAHTQHPVSTGGTFAPVLVRLRPDGTLDVSYNGDVIYNRLSTDFKPGRGARFGLGARTSLFAENHWIDDLLIAVCNDDLQPPTLACSTNLVLRACGNFATANYSVSATDDRDPNPVLTCLPSSGSPFLLGTNTVLCTASDESGNQAACAFDVIVLPDAPTINCAPNRTVECGTAWTFDPPSASGHCGGTNVTLATVGTITNALCGTTFSATRTWSATDSSSNSAICAQTITVVDATPPSLICPSNLTAVATSSKGTAVFFTVTATDLCDPTPLVTCLPASGQPFAIGTNQVTCTAVDACGNTNQCAFTVTVQPVTSRPSLACRRSGTNIVISWPTAFSNYKLQTSTQLEVPNAWTDWPEPVVIVGDQNTVEFRPIFNPPGHFFRLRNQ